MPPFKDEHILIIVPGSQTTLAQLGLPESFSPPSHRFPTRMFPAPDGKTWEPYRICERKKRSTDGDIKMGDTAEEQESELVEYLNDDEGAVWPIKEGRIENLPAFFAFLQHIHNTFSPTLHTPILLVAQPCWTSKNLEDITQFVFEKFKTPGLCIIDSAIATSYAYGVASSTVIDVGFEKTDITAITDFVISARGIVKESGGEGMTRKLMELLKPREFTRDMAEQLKKSPICEILPPGTPMPGTTEAAITEQVNKNNPTDVHMTGSVTSSIDVKITEIVPEKIDDKPIEEEGVLDIATIVTSGKTQDFLAKKEKEKAERAAARKATRDAEKSESAAAANKPVKLPNSRKQRAVFHYEEIVRGVLIPQKSPEPQITSATTSEDVKPDEATTGLTVNVPVLSGEDDTSIKEQPKVERKEEKENVREEENSHRIRRDIEIGIERFQAADNGYMDAISDTVYRTILSIYDVSKRQDAWESLIICGSGSKVRGFRDALLATLNGRYLLSPSTTALYSSEALSNIGTPSGTRAMTPGTSFPSSHVATATIGTPNPHFYAAHTPAIGHSSSHLSIPNAAASVSAAVHNQSHRSQTPTSIKFASPPSYFPEWKQFEEAVFLGSQVAAKVFFVNDQGQSKAFLSRLEFNEDGPTAIHQVGLVY